MPNNIYEGAIDHPRPGGGSGGTANYGGGGGSGSGTSGGGNDWPDDHGLSREELVSFLDSMGLEGEVWDKMIKEAVLNDWSEMEFWAHIKESDAFARNFPGIFYPGGKMRMTPTQYLKARWEYKQAAGQFGLRINNEQFGKVIGGGMSIDEFQDRLTAVQQVKENRQAWTEFARWADIGDAKPKDALDFMLGTADTKFYAAWEKAQLGLAAQQAGIGIGGEGTNQDHLTKKDIKYLAKMNPGFDVTSESGKAQLQLLAKQMMTTMPQSQLYGFGLSKRDLLVAVAGGKNQDAVLQKIARLKATVTASQNSKQATMSQGEKIDFAKQRDVAGD